MKVRNGTERVRVGDWGFWVYLLVDGRYMWTLSVGTLHVDAFFIFVNDFVDLMNVFPEHVS